MSKMTNLRLWCIIFVILDLIIAAVLIISISHSRYSHSSRRDALAQAVGYSDSMDEERQQTMINESLGDAARCVSIYGEVTARDGVVPICLSNSEENKCAVSIEIMLLDSGEIIAASGLVDPGWRLEEIELDTDPGKGEHQCLVRCLFYTMEGDIYLGRTAKQLLLRVE